MRIIEIAGIQGQYAVVTEYGVVVYCGTYHACLDFVCAEERGDHAQCN